MKKGVLIMLLGKKVRLHPTREQEKKLWQSCGVSRYVYNWSIGLQDKNYKKNKSFIKHTKLSKTMTRLKKSPIYAFIGEVAADIPQGALADVGSAYDNFFKGLAKRPAFKKRGKCKPKFYVNPQKLKSKNGKVLITKIGWIKCNPHIPEDVKYSNPRVSFDGKYWMLSVAYEQEIEQPVLTDNVIGIDIGIKELAVCSDEKVFPNINKTLKVRKIEKRLRRLQRKSSRKYEMNKDGNKFIKTKNNEKLEKKIKKIHRKLTNIRNDYTHQTTAAIVKTLPKKIIMEDLNIKGMLKNEHLSKAVQKQKLYDFKTKMKYKCEKYGIEFVEADRWYPSSKTCSNCGAIKKDLKLKDRVYTCRCGLSIDRDLNAAINLSKYEVNK